MREFHRRPNSVKDRGLGFDVFLPFAAMIALIGGSLFDRTSAAQSPFPPKTEAVGLKIEQDRAVLQWLDSARDHLERNELQSGIAFLLRVLEKRDVSLPGDDSKNWGAEIRAEQISLDLAREKAWRLSQKFPNEMRKQLELDLDRQAVDEWARVSVEGSHDELVQFASRYRFSMSGFIAAQRLASIERDAGRQRMAAAAFRRLRVHPRATPNQSTYASLACLESLISGGLWEEAAREVKSVGASRLVDSVNVAGRVVSTRLWLDEQSKRIASEIQSRQGMATENMVASNQVGSVPPRGVADPQTLATALEHGPAPTATWTCATTLPGNLVKSWERLRHYNRQQGVVSSLAIRPLIVGKLAIARSMESLIALDTSTGDIVWQEPHDEFKWITDRPTYLENISFQSNLVSTWHRRTEADSTFGFLVTDGQCVISVMEPDRLRFQLPLNRTLVPGNPAGTVQQAEQWNLLKSHWLSDGTLRWQIGGKPTGPSDVYGDCRFLGPPLPVGNVLFSIVQKRDDLKLMAIDGETGHLRWSRQLGTVPVRPAEEPARGRVACPVSLVDGLLICPTAHGSIVAVDPVTRSVEWIANYPVSERDLPIRPLNGMGTSLLVDSWWNEWREVSCLSSAESGLIVVVSPESNEMRALSRRDGREVWSVARGGAIHLAGLTSEVAIVVEPRAVRAHDLKTGQVRWRCETGEVSGRATLLGSMVFQPRRAGGLVVIDARDGSEKHGMIRDDVPFGTLIPFEGGWLTQTEEGVKRLETLGEARREAIAQWRAQPADESLAMSVARLDLQMGEATTARDRLADVVSADARGLRRDVLFSILRSWVTSDPRLREQRLLEWESMGREVLSLCESADEKIAAYRVLGDAALAAESRVAAVRSYLDGLDLLDSTTKRSIGEWPADEISGRSVRRDRIFVGGIDRAMADDVIGVRREGGKDADSIRSSIRSEMSRILDNKLVAARQSRDPFAVQRLIDRSLPLGWGRQTLLDEVAAMQFARSVKQTESALLTVTLSRDEATSRHATRHLIDLLLRSGWRTDADAIERRWMTNHPGEELTFPREAAALSEINKDVPADAAVAERRAKLMSSPVDPWPVGTPEFSVEPKAHNEDVHYFPITVDAAPGSLLSRLDVAIERQGRFVRFAGEGHVGKWTVTLPGPAPPLRSGFASQNQCEAWGVGRLLLLRLGGELFCISPVDDRGEPHAKLEWPSIDMVGDGPVNPGESPWLLTNVPARVGIRHEGFRLVDSFDRPIGRVGPVRPDYFCYQSQARLVAIETQSGRRLWERSDVPAQAVTFGDESHVYLWRTAERSLQTLSAIDGRTLSERPWAASADDVLMQQEGLTWLVRRPARNNPIPTDANSIELHDASDGRMRWGRRFADKSIPFVMDRDTVGVVEPGGRLHVLAAHSGESRGQPLQLPVPERVERIVTHFDDQRWYVAISEPVQKGAQLQAEQVWGGRRLPFMKGCWVAIDRNSIEVTWKRTLVDEPIPLDATRMAPVFVQMWRQPGANMLDGKGSEGIIRVVDKRTGTEIGTHRDIILQPYFVLHPSSNRESLDIRTEREVIRLRFESSFRQDQVPPKQNSRE